MPTSKAALRTAVTTDMLRDNEKALRATGAFTIAADSGDAKSSNGQALLKTLYAGVIRARTAIMGINQIVDYNLTEDVRILSQAGGTVYYAVGSYLPLYTWQSDPHGTGASTDRSFVAQALSTRSVSIDIDSLLYIKVSWYSFDRAGLPGGVEESLVQQSMESGLTNMEAFIRFDALEGFLKQQADADRRDIAWDPTGNAEPTDAVKFKFRKLFFDIRKELTQQYTDKVRGFNDGDILMFVNYATLFLAIETFGSFITESAARTQIEGYMGRFAGVDIYLIPQLGSSIPVTAKIHKSKVWNFTGTDFFFAVRNPSGGAYFKYPVSLTIPTTTWNQLSNQGDPISGVTMMFQVSSDQGRLLWKDSSLTKLTGAPKILQRYRFHV